jgi:XTP/dITP diphosphohydrolase
MPARSQVVLASQNQGKLKELRHLFEVLGRELVALSDHSSVAPEETATTFVENALIKARHATQVTGLPSLADDSGLCVQALGGAPGVYSARFASLAAGANTGSSFDSIDAANIDSANNAALLHALDGITDRRAYFLCVLVYLRTPDDPEPLIATGRWHGEILRAPRGSQGFGYDPLFMDPALGMSSAELPRETKNRVSHRARAAAQLAALLAERP